MTNSIEEQTPRPVRDSRNHRVRNVLGSLLAAGSLSAVATLAPSRGRPPEAAGVSAPKAPERSKGNQVATADQILKYSKKLAYQARHKLDFGSKQSDGSEVYNDFVNNPDGSVKYTYLVTIGPQGDIKIEILVGGPNSSSNILDLSQNEVNGKSVWKIKETASSENDPNGISFSYSSDPSASRKLNETTLHAFYETASGVITDINQGNLPDIQLIPGEGQVV